MSQLLMLYMGSLTIRSIGIAAIAAICCWKMRNAAMRHAVWAAVLGAMLLLPALDYLLPAAWIPARIHRIAAEPAIKLRAVAGTSTESVPMQHAHQASPAVSLSSQVTNLNWWWCADAIYGLVAFAMLIRLFMGYRAIWKLQRRGKPITSAVWDEIVASNCLRWRIPELLESEELQVPITAAVFRPVVILPADWRIWNDWKLRAVLLHEIAHVRRGDWGIAAAAALVKCVYWLNPLSWFLERQLSLLAEQASDDASIVGTQDTTRYAEILLEFAVKAQNGGRYMKRSVAMAQYRMKTRIERVLADRQPGTGLLKIAGWMLVLLLAMPALYSAAAIQVASVHSSAPALKSASVAAQPVLPYIAVAGSQTKPQPTPAIEPQPEPGDPLRLKLQEVQRAYLEMVQKTRIAEAQRQENPGQASRSHAPQNASEFSIQDLEQMEQLKKLTAEMEMMVRQIPADERLRREYEIALTRLQGVSAGIDLSSRQQKEVDFNFQEYRIKPKDVLTVNVFRHPELSLKVTVQPDGLISTPLVQSLPASGFTPAQLKVEIEKRLKEFVDSPNVTVILESN